MSRKSQKPIDHELEQFLDGLGEYVKAQREAMGLSQAQLAAKVGISVGIVADVEQGYVVNITHHKRLADFFGLPFGYGVSNDVEAKIRKLHGDLCARVEQLATDLGHRLDLLSERVEHLGIRVEQLEEAMHFQRRVSRREFTGSSSLGLLGAVIPEPISGFFAEAGFPALSTGDVEAMLASCDDLDVRCRALGGGTVFDVTVDMDRKAIRWLSEGRYAGRVKDELAVLCAKLKASAGWLAFDTERLELAERFLNDAIAYARIAGCVQVEVLALNNLCALLNRQGRYHHALRTAETGLLIAPVDASRTRAIFHMRRLSTFGLQGDEEGLSKELGAARYHYELGRIGGDPKWTDWGEQAVSSVAGEAYVDLGQAQKGAELLRSIVGGADAVGGRHAQLRNAVSLGHALAKQGDVAQASEHAMALVPEVFEFQSARVQRRLHTLYVQLKDKPAIPQARDFSDAYDEAVARMAGNP